LGTPDIAQLGIAYVPENMGIFGDLSVRENLLLFSNPASLKRENMTVRLSYDEGRTWAASKTIHAGPAAYSCMTVLSDLTAACLYECGDKQPYEKIAFARFNVEWLTDGKDTIAPPAPR
jgi:sialidase-1